MTHHSRLAGYNSSMTTLPDRQPPTRGAKTRLDRLLVERGLAESRERAQALILAGSVRVAGRPAHQAGTVYPADAPIEVAAPLPYVSRGGLKLAHALDAFGVAVAGLVCADLGASTGGFTDVLLQRGAAQVYAVDVGYGQLDYRLRTDARVVVLDRTNARYLESLPQPIDLVVIDVSFISLKLILPAARRVLGPAGQVIALVKPQFEAGRREVGKGGVVRDPAVHAAVLRQVAEAASGLGFVLRGLARSPITGPAGNVEFLARWVLEGEPVSLEPALKQVLQHD